jgi:hypothetical protein
MIASLLEPDFTTGIWSGVAQRTEANRSDVERLSIDPKAAITFLAIDWFNAVAQFRNEEVALLDSGRFDKFLDEHRLAVATCISQGERLAFGVKKQGLLQGAGFTAEDIRATIDSLRETQRGVHGPHNHPRTNENIRAILETA